MGGPCHVRERLARRYSDRHGRPAGRTGYCYIAVDWMQYVVSLVAIASGGATLLTRICW
jgi:hypothetical protein